MNVLAGIAIAVFAGSINGLFALPMKAMKKWEWENIWFPFSIVSFFIFPWLIAKVSIPQMEEAIRMLCPCDIVSAMITGAFAYTGSLICSLAFQMIGQALTFALLVGAMTIVGVLFPILIYHPEVVPTQTGFYILLGIGMVFVSLVLSVVAGIRKEKSQCAATTEKKNNTFIAGIVFALVGGSLGGLISLGMNTGWANSLKMVAVNFGQADAMQASNLVLFFVLLGGGIPNIVYTVYQLTRNQRWHLYRQKESWWYWLLLIMMCLQYTGSVILWGISSSENLLGKLGSSVGWAIFVSFIVISSNLGGFLTGEWKNAGKRAIALMGIALLIILMAMATIGYGNYMLH